jgi:hypothetical protein
MKNYESIADALADLKNRGYKENFRREPAVIYSIESDLWIAPDQFNIDEFYRFDENLGPEAERVIYAISSNVGIKGTLLDECGIYGDNISFEMSEKLQVHLTG